MNGPKRSRPGTATTTAIDPTAPRAAAHQHHDCTPASPTSSPLTASLSLPASGCRWRRWSVLAGAGSCGAAGELADVGGKGLGGELEAFGHGQVWAPDVGDLVGGHGGLEDVDAGGGEVTGVLGEGGDAEDAAGVGVGDDLDEPAGVPVDDGAWDVREGQDAAVAADPGGAGLLVGHPDGGQGGAGEYDPGQVAVVDLAAGAGEGVVRGEGAVGGGDVHELRVGGDVAGGPDAWVGGAQVVVDDDLAALAGAHVDGVEAERAGDRAAARGDEDLGAAELL